MNKNHLLNNSTDTMLDELKQLDERLKRLQKAFAATKTSRGKNSLFTPENITKSIQFLKKVNPSEKYMVNALTSLVPFAREADEDLEHWQKKKIYIRNPDLSSDTTAFTKKLKCKLPQNKII